jgi:hypothetical protein
MERVCWVVGVLACSSVACGAYTSQVLSSDGRSFGGSGDPDPYVLAARESAARDLSCTRESIAVQVLRGFRDSKFVADGCGTRAVYECATRADLTKVGFAESHWACEMVLTSRFALASGAPGPDATRTALPLATSPQ